MVFDIELVNLPEAYHNQILPKLPKGYAIENRVKQGRNYVVRGSEEYAEMDINKAIALFLKPLDSLKHLLMQCEGELRVAVFYNAVSCTLNFTDFELLSAMNLRLELSCYPTSG